jgi:hypothetical protein
VRSDGVVQARYATPIKVSGVRFGIAGIRGTDSVYGFKVRDDEAVKRFCAVYGTS